MNVLLDRQALDLNQLTRLRHVVLAHCRSDWFNVEDAVPVFCPALLLGPCTEILDLRDPDESAYVDDFEPEQVLLYSLRTCNHTLPH